MYKDLWKGSEPTQEQLDTIKEKICNSKKKTTGQYMYLILVIIILCAIMIP